MGLYINPESGTKREWLCVNARSWPEATKPELAIFNYKGERLPVVYVDNRSFDAIAIAFNKTEAMRFYEGRNDALWFTAPRSALTEWLPK